MPSTASLFKDTDHPFRWFLAPYANIFFINVDNFESYKDAKPAIRKWVETIVGLKRYQSFSLYRLCQYVSCNLRQSYTREYMYPLIFFPRCPPITFYRASWLLVYAPIFQGFQTPDSAACNKVYSKLSSDFYADRAGDRTVNLIPVSVVVPSHSEDSIAAAYVDFFSKLREGIVYSFFHRSAQYDSDIRRLDSCRGTSQFDFRQLFLVKESLALMYQLMQLPQEALRQYGELEALLSVVPVGTLPDNDWPLPVVDDSGVGLRKIGMGTGTGTGNDGEIANALGTVGAECAAEENAVDNFKSFWKDPMREGENILLYSINSARMRVLKNKIGIRELRRYLFARQIHFLAQQHKGRECAVKALQYVTDTYDSIVRDLSTSRLEREQRLRQADLWALCAAVKIVRSCRGYICRQQEHEQKEAKSESIALADTAGITIDVIGTGAETGDLADLELHLQSSAVDRETLLLRELSAPLGELLQLAIKRLNSLSSFFVTKISSSSSDVVDNPSRDVESHSIRESYCYGDIALSLAQSLYVPQNHLQRLHETSGGTANHELVGQPVADEADGDIMLKALLSMPMLHDGADSAAVEDCLHAELDKVKPMLPYQFYLNVKPLLSEGCICYTERDVTGSNLVPGGK